MFFGEGTSDSPSRSMWLFTLGFFLLTCLWVYRPALTAPMMSDDGAFVVALAENHRLDADFVWDVLNPASSLKYEVGIYSPFYLIVSRAESWIFGDQLIGYHLVNVVVHALNVMLLIALAISSGVSRSAALLGGAFFAFHPANVEAVVWISQLRGLLALSCSLAALLCLRRLPTGSALLFGAGLLFKPAAFFALPVVISLWWIGRGDSKEGGVAPATVIAWSLMLALFAIPYLLSYQAVAIPISSGYDDVATHIRSIASYGARYLVMAVASYGVSGYHQPPPATWLGLWWLASIPLAVLLVWRIVVTLKQGKQEAAHWISAVGGWAPISQVFPLYFAMGDRYLYFILPGLILASLLMFEDVSSRLEARRRAGSGWDRSRRLARSIVGIGVVGLLVVFALRASERSELWLGEVPGGWLMDEASRNYPEGGIAQYYRGLEAVDRGDLAAATEHIARSADAGYFVLHNFLSDPALEPLRATPEYRELELDITRRLLAYYLDASHIDQRRMHQIGVQHFRLGDYDAAERALEKAVRMDGSMRRRILMELGAVRQRRRQAESD